MTTPVLDGPEILERIAASGLRGRGGGWFPVARKWRAVRAEAGDAFVVGNGAEGEPGSIKDRHVLLTQPRAVLDGLALAARAVGARQAVIFLKASSTAAAAVLARELPYPGLDVTVRHGDDSYIVGEETAALESLEGRRAWPRPKPPLPAAVGFQGRPTLVQNVETLARVPAAVADPATYRASETLRVSLWGHVRRPGLYEVRLGTPLRTLIDEHGGGAPDGVAMVFPAGPSAPPLPGSDLDVALDPDVLRARGSGLGTGAVLVIGRTPCPLCVAVSLAGFFEREACGQCPPCVVGSRNLARVVRGLEHGGARAKDLQDAAEVAGFMRDHGYCAHGRTAAAAVTGMLAQERGAVATHLAARGCPHAAAACSPFDPGSPERLAIEATLGARA